jgi:hypothetical protein
MQGFQAVRHDNIDVPLGQSIDVNLQMGDVTITDEIVVIADATQVSTVSNNVSHNIGRSFIDRQPLARDVMSLINYAPGVQNGLAYGASSDAQNAYNLDGVDVSDPDTGAQWVQPSMDWVQEIVVGGLGSDAEYGGFTGAMTNLITKSGGNQLHGDFRAYYSGGSLNEENAPEGVEGTNKVAKDIDASASLGGPVVRDKVWFFVSLNQRQLAIDPFFSAGAPADDQADSDLTLPRGLAKLTWQISSNTKLMGLVDYDGVETEYQGVGGYTLASGAESQDSPSYTYNLTLESLINDSNLLAVRLTGLTGGADYFPYHGDTPNHYDSWEGWDWGNLAQNAYKDIDRNVLDASWSLFADGLFTKNDSHNFKFGATYETIASDLITSRNGGVSYYDDSWYCDSTDAYFDDPICGAFSSDWGGEMNLRSEMEGLHAYAQDSWQTGRITLNYGVRYTKYIGNFADPVSAPTSGGSNVYDVNMWAPRLGFVWDLMGNGKTAFKLHYGVYYDGMSVVYYDREASGDALSDTIFLDYNFDTGEFDIPAGGSVNAYAGMDPDIKHPSVEQLVVTLEHQLFDDILIGVDYIRRENKDIVAMLTSNVEDYDMLVAPNNPLGGGPLPFFDLLAPQENLIRNPDNATRDYDSVALRLQKRYSNRWFLDTSLVWSDLTGNAQWWDNSYVDDFSDLNGFVNADGTLPYNSEWVFKLSGSVDLPWNFMVSGFYQYQTGEHWTPYVEMDGLDYNNRTPVYLIPRGGEQYDNRSVLDLHLQYDLKLGGAVVLALFVDSFNTLNSDKVNEVEQRWGDYWYAYWNHPEESEWAPSDSYEAPTSIQQPRVVRIGAKFSF